MSYTKTVWVDEIPYTSPVKYRIKDSGGNILYDNATIEVVTSIIAGTPLTAINLNHLETGVYNAQVAADAASAAAANAQSAADQATYLYPLRDVPMEIVLNGPVALTTNDKGYRRIPDKLNGGTLVVVAAMCVGASSSGIVTLTLKNNGVSMLTVNITLDQGETDTLTAATAAIIDGGQCTVHTGDHIEGAVIGAGTGVTYCSIQLILRPA